MFGNGNGQGGGGWPLPQGYGPQGQQPQQQMPGQNPGLGGGMPQQQGVQPTGQFMVQPGGGISYGTQNLPPHGPPQQGGWPQGQQLPMGPAGQYGLPMQQPAPPQQQMNPMAQVPGQQPQTGGWPTQQTQGWPQQQAPGSPSQQQWPQGQPAQQQQQQQLNPQTRLDGPNVPPELRGRTIAEAMAIYNSTATMAQGFGRPAQQPQVSQQQPQQPQGAAGSFWQNPEQRLQEIVSGVVDQRLGPVVQYTQVQALTGARMAAQQQVPDFAALEAEIGQLVANANPEALANPNTWIGAADIVRGRQMREGRYQPPQASPSARVPGASAAVMQPGGLPGMPNSTQLPTSAFFTEAPSAPSVTGYGATPVQPTQQDVFYAQQFKMPVEGYMAWKYGVQPSTVPNPNSTFVGQQQPSAPWHYGPFAGTPAGGAR